MNKIYYLFCPKNKTESLFLCKGNNFIDKPYLKSNVYPVGIIFSKSMKIILSAINQKKFSFSPNELLKGVIDFSKEDSSFSNICCNDENLKMIFNAVLGDNRELFEKIDIRNFFNTLIRVNDYLSLCSDNKYLCSITNFNKQLSIMGENFPSYSYYGDNTEKGKKYFSPKIVGRTIPLFENNMVKLSTEQFGKLELPLYVYEIKLISDLLISSLHQIFENNYTITKCRFCGDYFVAKSKRNKYCPTEDYKYEKENCYYIAHKRRVKSLCDDEIERMYNSVRNMLMRKRNCDIDYNGEHTKRYEDFKKRRKEYIRDIELGKASKDDYHNWLKSFYVYKYKK